MMSLVKISPGNPRSPLKKAEKAVFPMPAIDCRHRLCPLPGHTQRGFARTARSATVRNGHHPTIGNCKMPHSRAIWATAVGSSLSAQGLYGNYLKLSRKVIYGKKGQLCTRENESP